MATAKTKKNTTAGQATDDKKTGGKRGAAAKTKRPPAFKKPSKKKRSTRGEAPGAILLLIGVVMLFCLATTSNGAAILFLRQLAKGTFGKMAAFVALYLGALGVQVIMGNKWPLRGTVSFAAALLIVCLGTLLEVYKIEDLMRVLNNSGYAQNYNGVLWQAFQSSKNTTLGGGSLGALLAYPLYKLMDVAGSTLVLLFLLGMLIVWIVRMFAPDARDRFGDWVRELRENLAERREERRLEREEEAREYDDAILAPLPKELLETEEEPPKKRGKKQAQQPAPVEPVQRPAPAAQAAPQRPAPMAAPAPAPRAAARPANRQPTLFIEDILPDNGREPYFERDEEPARPKTRKGFMPDFLMRKQKEYDEAYGAFEDDSFNESEYQEMPGWQDEPAPAQPQQPAQEEAGELRRGEEAAASYRAAFREGSRRARYAQQRQAIMGEAQNEVISFQTDEQIAAARDEWKPAALEEQPAAEETPAVEAPAAQPPESEPDEQEKPLPAPETESAQDELPPWEEPEAPAPQQEPEPDEADDDPFGTPWEPVAPEYDENREPSAPVRQHRSGGQSGYFPMGDVTRKLPEIPKEERLDRPDWKPPEPAETTVEQVPAQEEEYRQPPFSLLERDEEAVRVDTRDADARGAQKLEETLKSFGVVAHVIKVVHGPALTRYELQPAPGIKVSKIVGLTDDIALNMAALGVRIEAPIPGKAAIGIELANDKIATVHLRDVLESDESFHHPSRLAVALGKDIAGKRIIADLAKMPHLLIAGATGSGKSVCINTIITSIIYRATPEEVRLILVDPKKVELSVYNGIPHLLVPVVTDPKKASGALNWAVREMDERYKVFADCGVRDIKGYNAQRGDKPLMPSIVVIIDELSDLMLVAPGEVEESICRLAQLARACGIHLVIATQRPSVNVITGIIKANIPSRIAFAVSSQVDSRTILDGAGAEKLLGRGDMLFAPAGSGKPIRVQGCFVSDDEVSRVVQYVKNRHTVDYSQAVIEALSASDNEEAEEHEEDKNDAPFDALFEQAVEMSIDAGQASISMLQRRLRIGYARAGRIVDEMSRRGIIAPADGAKPRDVLITRDDFALMFPKGGDRG